MFEPILHRAAPAAGTKHGTLGSEPGTLVSNRDALGMQRPSPSNAEPLRRAIAVGRGNAMLIPRRGTLALPPMAYLNRRGSCPAVLTPFLFHLIIKRVAPLLNVLQALLMRGKSFFVQRSECTLVLVLAGRACPVARPDEEELICYKGLTVLDP